jgi:hypothetical protein
LSLICPLSQLLARLRQRRKRRAQVSLIVWLRIIAIFSVYADVSRHKRMYPNCMIALSASIGEALSRQFGA